VTVGNSLGMQILGNASVERGIWRMWHHKHPPLRKTRKERDTPQDEYSRLLRPLCGNILCEACPLTWAAIVTALMRRIL
jgi:hypothetical protein